MMEEISFGIVPIKRMNGEWYMLIVKHSTGYWAFPKGHAEGGESEEETAKRELKEETGLDIVNFYSTETFREEYQFSRTGKRIFKTVVYRVAEVTGKVKIQADEIEDSQWVPVREAEKYVTFPESKRICQKVLILLNK